MPPASTAPLPEHWTAKKDRRGRTFYSNHRTRTTTWERPVLDSDPSSQGEEPPPYERPAPATQNAPAGFSCTCTPCSCTPWFTFWVVAMLGWVIWILAVTAAEDDQWFDNVDSFSAGDDVVLDDCDDNRLTDEFCNLYVTFSALQFLAVSVATASVLFLVVALFRPAAGKYCSTYSLGIAAGTLMAMYALFQMLAFVIVVIIEKTETNFGGSTATVEDPELGATFGVAAAGVLLGMLQAGVVLVFARGSGDGPFYNCIPNSTGALTPARSASVNGGRMSVNSGLSMPQPPRPVGHSSARVARQAPQPTDTRPPAQAPRSGSTFYQDETTPDGHLRVASPDVLRAVARATQAAQYSGLREAVVYPVESPGGGPAVEDRVVPAPGANRVVQSPVVVTHAAAQYSGGASQAVESPPWSQVVQPAVVSSPAVESTTVATPVVQPPVASPTAVSAASTSQAVQPTEASSVAQPTVASLTIDPAVASPAVQPSVASPDVESTAASLTVEPAVTSPAAQLPVASPAVQPAVASPGVESPVASPSVEPAVASPAVQLSVASPAVQSAVTSPVVESPVASPAVQPAVTSPAVQSPAVSLSVEPAVASPAVQPAVTSPSVEHAVETPTVQSPKASPE